tara:strand:+ start:432 stop:731 length:300 start_codon:yes stop_codon:yes gene_type:complete
VQKYTREQKLLYYFWLDEMIFHQWSQYLDLKLDPDNEVDENKKAENDEQCLLKLELIDFYQEMLDTAGKEFTLDELNEWHIEKYGEIPSFLRYYRDLSI